MREGGRNERKRGMFASRFMCAGVEWLNFWISQPCVAAILEVDEQKPGQAPLANQVIARNDDSMPPSVSAHC